MSSSSPSVIFADPDGWRVGRIGGEGALGREAVIAPHDAPADVLAAALRANGCAGRPVVLALPSDACLCAPVATGDLPARHRGQAMLYRLEERLPVSAEDVVADFIPTGPAGALGVCVQRRPLHVLLDALRAAGVAKVAAACPRSLLALQQFLDAPDAAHRAPNAGQPEMILWADGQHLEAFLLGPDRALHAWAVMPDDPHDVALYINMQSLGGGTNPSERGGIRPQRVVACGVSPEVLERLRQVFAGQVETVPAVSIHGLAASAARAVLARRLQPWVDFAQADAAGGSASRRAFAQARGPLAWAAACAAVLALSVLVALFWRAARYDGLAAEYDARQRDVFRRAFPGQPIPRDVRSRLASEDQRLRSGAAGPGGPAAAGSVRGGMSAADGLLALRDIVAALPADLRFSVSELRLDGAGNGGFTVRGEARSHADAQAIAEALRVRFDIEPPSTEFRGAAVGFTITGGFVAPVEAGAPAMVSAARRGASSGGER